ncbi:MAG: hypothetical protein PVH61_39840 [Candidatus Aminicenantes bacterium]|jgi:hypothetical protein
MSLIQLLETRKDKIIDEANMALERTHLEHYEKSGVEENERRLKLLYQLLLPCVKSRNLNPLTDHIRDIARERFYSGFALYEVHTAINVLEETIWRQILKYLNPLEFAEALGLVSTVLGAGKSTLANVYVSLASQTKVPSLDLSALFKGTDGN